MKAFIAKSAWVEEEGIRLDAKGYAEGAIAARSKIIEGPFAWLSLEKVARIFRGPLHKRHFIRDTARSIAYLAASDVTRIDLPTDMRLSNALTPVLPILRIEAGWTLISSAGTIGDATYVRDELTKFAISQDMLRVAPFDNILSGYLFAYLATKDARALLRFRTYGSVVDRIEPQHIADLPVPLPNEEKQQHIHDQVVGAAQARTEANKLLSEIAEYFDGLAGPMPSFHDHAKAAGIIRQSHLNLRLDAFYHVGWASETRFDGERVGDLATVISTNRVPRIYVQNGVPFLSGIDIFQVRPKPRVHLAGYIADRFEARVRSKDIAIQGSGQRYGLLGRPAYIGTRLDRWAASHDLFRIRASSIIDTARIYAFLRSDSGHRAMLRHSYGTSIPHVNPEGIASVRVPTLPTDLAVKATRALQLIEQADADEEQAIREVEQWVNSSH